MSPLDPMLRRVLSPVLRRMQPASQCEVCRSWSTQRVCANCCSRLVRPVARCTRCALPMGNAAPVCGTCLRSPPPFARTVCAVDYAFPWDRLILDLKFHARVDLATPLAAQLSSALRAVQGANQGTSTMQGIDAVLPVPLAPARLAERGYNQAWELARRVAREFGLPAKATWLQRPLGGAHQADLPRAARATNLRGAFMVHPRDKPHIAGRHLALVDDVMTTGATAREASAALLHAGAASVVFWAVARTP